MLCTMNITTTIRTLQTVDLTITCSFFYVLILPFYFSVLHLTRSRCVCVCVFFSCRCLCTRPLHYSIICIWDTVCMPMDKNKVYFSQFASLCMCIYVHVVALFSRCKHVFIFEGMFFSPKKINFIRLTFIKKRSGSLLGVESLPVWIKHFRKSKFKMPMLTSFWQNSTNFKIALRA